ncbi:MAG: 30S ribosomal protein S9 [Solirubrobacterales bacterium]
MTPSEDADREQDEAPEAAEPEAAEDQPAAEVPAEQAETPAEDDAGAAEDQPAAEAPAEEPASETGAEPAEDQPAAEASPERPEPAPKDGEKKDVVPGADLEPIAIAEERELTAEERAAREAEEEERRAREAAAAAAENDDETIAPRTVTVPADTQIQATGKRKSAVARVIVRAGDGSFEINDRGIDEYFKSSQHQALARQPLVTSGYESAVDVRVRVHGGGISGQAGAVRHGVARALTALEPELRPDLKRRGMLTRDDRRKERKKAGLKKARKRPQFSKR